MAAYLSEEQPYSGLYPSYSEHHVSYPSLPAHDAAVYHDSTSRRQARHLSYSQQSTSGSFAEFLREDDERFFATFPEAARAAAQQHNPGWVVLGDQYPGFAGSTAFSLRPSQEIYTYSLSTTTTPGHAPNTAQNMQDSYSVEYRTAGSPSHAPYPFPTDLNSGGGISSDEYIQSPQDALQPLQSDFNAASFFSQSIADSEIHEGLRGLQRDNFPTQHVSLSPSVAHSPQIHSPEPATLEYSVFSSHMYSLSPEAIIPRSPTSPIPLPSSTLSPMAMVSPPEELSLPPLPPESQSDSEPPADDLSGPSSSKAVLPKPSVKRKRRRNLSEELQSNSQSGYMGKIPLPKPTQPPVPKAPKHRPTSQSEKKSLSLACFFCRGRKIACGPQDPNSADRTCNQCHRRSLKCEYPTESRRGMRKNKSGTGFRAEKGFVEAPAPKVAIPSTSASTSDPKA